MRSNTVIKIVDFGTSKNEYNKPEKLQYSLYNFISQTKTEPKVNETNKEVVPKQSPTIGKTQVNKEIRYNKRDVKYYKEFCYDNKNNVILEVRRTSDGMLSSYVEYKYNRNNQKCECKYYNANGELNYYTKYEFDNSGNVAKETRFNAYHCIDYYMVYKYNRSGVLEKFTKYDANGKEKRF